MSNLPVQLPAIKAYEGSSLTIRLNMYEGFTPPATIAFEVYFKRVKKYEVSGVYNPSLRRITANFTADQIKEMPLIADVKIRFDEAYPFQVQIKPTDDGTSDGVVGYDITQSGDTYIVVEMPAETLINGLTQVVENLTVTSVSTFAEMLALCVFGESRNFRVLQDEFQEDERVEYKWEGDVLYEYGGLSVCEVQPQPQL